MGLTHEPIPIVDQTPISPEFIIFKDDGAAAGTYALQAAPAPATDYYVITDILASNRDAAEVELFLQENASVVQRSITMGFAEDGGASVHLNVNIPFAPGEGIDVVATGTSADWGIEVHGRQLTP